MFVQDGNGEYVFLNARYMARSVDIVEYKVQQTHFFLEKLREADLDFFAAQCFVDAFAASARSITFSMQSALNDMPGFAEWYEDRQALLRKDAVCKFFHDYRTVSIHIGDTVLRGGTMKRSNSGHLVVEYFFTAIPDLTNVPQGNVLCICTDYFRFLIGCVYEMMITFKYQLDDRWYFTPDNFSRIGKSIEDAEEELGLPRGWTAVGDAFSEENRWRTLRRTYAVGCQLNDLFAEYLGKTIQGPDDNTEQANGC